MTKKGVLPIILLLLLLLGLGGYYFSVSRNAEKKYELTSLDKDDNSINKEEDLELEFSDIEKGDDYGIEDGILCFGKYTDEYEINAYKMPDGEHIEYYENGNIKLKCNYENRRLDGEFISYHENGNIWEERHYKKGNRDGNWNVYTVDGKFLLKESYIEGKRDGEAIFEPPRDSEYWNIEDNYNPTYCIRATYNNGELEYADAESATYWVLEKLEGKGNYKREIFAGEETNDIYYYKDGKFIGEGTPEDSEKNLKDGEVIEYYDDGSIWEQKNYKNGKLHGESISYYDNGNIEYKENYRDGKLDGEQIYYHYNGSIYYKEYYSTKEVPSDDKDTKYIEYYKDGKIYFKETYKNGKLNGKANRYNEDGKIALEFNYKDGKTEGESITYFKDGTISKKENYKNDKLEGEYISYYENGQIYFQCFYRKDVLVGNYIKYTRDGEILEKSFYRDYLRIK